MRGFACGELDFAVADASFGIEILLKALVFEAKWELIFEDSRDADITKLKAGNARTIGREQAEDRLKSLIKNPLPPSCAHFKTLQKHRNKLIHFFHPALFSEAEKTQVAKDLANAWSALRDLRALPRFEPVFREHSAAFHALDARLLVIDDYLDQQAATIRSRHPHVDSLEQCPACKRKTFDGDCELCDYHEPSHRNLTQGVELITPADCPKCGGTETVVHSGAASRCTECAAALGPIATCEYCGASRVPTEMDDDDVGSFYFGCEKCGGRIGELMNRDD